VIAVRRTVLALILAALAVAGVGMAAQAAPQIVATSKAFLYGQPVCYAPCRVAFEVRLDGDVAVTPDGKPAVIWTIKPAEATPGELQVGTNYVGTSFFHTFDAPGAYRVVVYQIGADGSIQGSEITITVMQQTIEEKLLSIADSILRFLIDVLGLLPIRILIGG
jgi:hypothetical protein